MLKIGHRGACGYEPENTLRSFKKALELQVEMVELDVYLCASGELVVIHDDRVDRTTNGKGYVEKMTLSELKLLDAGQGEKIPTLTEVLDLVNRQVKVNIELKGLDTAKPVAEIIDHYLKDKGWSVDDFLVSSFNHYELRDFHTVCPLVKIGALLTGIPIGMVDFALAVDAYSINPCVEFINEEFVKEAHQKNLKVFVWTVNHPDDIKRMREIGVDGIFTNFPDRVNNN